MQLCIFPCCANSQRRSLSHFLAAVTSPPHKRQNTSIWTANGSTSASLVQIILSIVLWGYAFVQFAGRSCTCLKTKTSHKIKKKQGKKESMLLLFWVVLLRHALYFRLSGHGASRAFPAEETTVQTSSLLNLLLFLRFRKTYFIKVCYFNYSMFIISSS